MTLREFLQHACTLFLVGLICGERFLRAELLAKKPSIFLDQLSDLIERPVIDTETAVKKLLTSSVLPNDQKNILDINPALREHFKNNLMPFPLKGFHLWEVLTQKGDFISLRPDFSSFETSTLEMFEESEQINLPLLESVKDILNSDDTRAQWRKLGRETFFFTIPGYPDTLGYLFFWRDFGVSLFFELSFFEQRLQALKFPFQSIYLLDNQRSLFLSFPKLPSFVSKTLENRPALDFLNLGISEGVWISEDSKFRTQVEFRRLGKSQVYIAALYAPEVVPLLTQIGSKYRAFIQVTLGLLILFLGGFYLIRIKAKRLNSYPLQDEGSEKTLLPQNLKKLEEPTVFAAANSPLVKASDPSSTVESDTTNKKTPLPDKKVTPKNIYELYDIISLKTHNTHLLEKFPILFSRLLRTKNLEDLKFWQSLIVLKLDVRDGQESDTTQNRLAPALQNNSPRKQIHCSSLCSQSLLKHENATRSQEKNFSEFFFLKSSTSTLMLQDRKDEALELLPTLPPLSASNYLAEQASQVFEHACISWVSTEVLILLTSYLKYLKTQSHRNSGFIEPWDFKWQIAIQQEQSFPQNIDNTFSFKFSSDRGTPSSKKHFVEFSLEIYRSATCVDLSTKRPQASSAIKDFVEAPLESVESILSSKPKIDDRSAFSRVDSSIYNRTIQFWKEWGEAFQYVLHAHTDGPLIHLTMPEIINHSFSNGPNGENLDLETNGTNQSQTEEPLLTLFKIYVPTCPEWNNSIKIKSDHHDADENFLIGSHVAASSGHPIHRDERSFEVALIQDFMEHYDRLFMTSENRVSQEIDDEKLKEFHSRKLESSQVYDRMEEIDAIINELNEIPSIQDVSHENKTISSTVSLSKNENNPKKSSALGLYWELLNFQEFNSKQKPGNTSKNMQDTQI